MHCPWCRAPATTAFAGPERMSPGPGSATPATASAALAGSAPATFAGHVAGVGVWRGRTRLRRARRSASAFRVIVPEQRSVSVIKLWPLECLP